jgi:hypothetical protein
MSGPQATGGPDADVGAEAGDDVDAAASEATAATATDSAGAGAVGGPTEAGDGSEAAAGGATLGMAAESAGTGAAGGADAGVAAGASPERSEYDRVPTRARWFVGVLLVLLAVPGLVGFELWPLTGWRLFSLSRDGSQTKWVVQAVAEDGSSRPVSLEELPLRYRHAEWPMAELPGASDDRRQAVCEALLGAVVDVVPGTTAVEITRDRQELVKRGGEWTLMHDPEVVHTCTVPAGGEGRP